MRSAPAGLEALETLLVTARPRGLDVQLNRPDDDNSINPRMLAELHRVLDVVHTTPDIRFLLLRGVRGWFCSGMDFKAFTRTGTREDDAPADDAYMRLLQRLAGAPCLTLAAVDGAVRAGGVGLAAACDIVTASPRSRFLLSEALWGMLPCCVAPFLIRRVGYQRAYRLTLTTSEIDADRAHDWGLVDALADQPEAAARRFAPRVARLHQSTPTTLKAFMPRMWLFDEAMSRRAVATTAALMAREKVHRAVGIFVATGRFPWEGHATENYGGFGTI